MSTSDEGGGNSALAACLDGMKCETNDDCAMGSHCNIRLEPPACEKLYCGPLGTSCAEVANCSTGLDCVNHVDPNGAVTLSDGFCCKPEGQSCEKDGDCCGVDIDEDLIYASCNAGTCKRVCTKLGDNCEVDGQCCGGASCSDDGVCVGIGGGSCASCADTYAKGDFLSVVLCLGADEDYANLRGCGCDKCPAECVSSCPDVDSIDPTCDACVQMMCPSEYAKCEHH